MQKVGSPVFLMMAIFMFSTNIMTAQATTMIFVRHCEKAPGNDPELSAAGHARAQKLADALRDHDVAAIYSTPFKRTRQTMKPLSELRGIAVTDYSPAIPEDKFIADLKEKHKGKTIVVAGHSNTVPALAGAALKRASGIEIAEDHYDNLIIVTVASGCEPQLVRLRY